MELQQLDPGVESAMKAIAYTKYGPPDVLQLRDVEKPSPKDNEVLVQIHASSVNAFEWRRFSLPQVFIRMMGGGLREPKDTKIGADLAGRVEAVGAKVTQFQAGDEVFGIRRGAFAQYVCAPENLLAPKPTNVSFDAAAAVPLAGLTALQGVRDQGQIQPGQDVLINGAGGGVGTFAVQLAKSFGARVTAVCGSRNVDITRSIGADRVIDYTKEDFTKSRELYDVIIAANGYHSIFAYRRALKPNGIYVVLGGTMGQIVQGMLLAPILSWLGNKKMRGLLTRPNQKDLVFLKELIEAGKIVPVIDRAYPLGEVAEAIRYLLEGHPRGKVVITVEHSVEKVVDRQLIGG
jgi:NADPH:quinone reductase-like Zn-dependent oxidoreductase